MLPPNARSTPMCPGALRATPRAVPTVRPSPAPTRRTARWGDMPVRAPSDLAKDWWQRWPGLLLAELDAFAAKGATTSIVHQDKGILLLEIIWPRDGESLKLRVGYSPLHPYFRPRVAAPDLHQLRHRSAADGGLCLLAQGNGLWSPSERVADLIAIQLDRIFEVNALREAGDWEGAAEVEENAPDPLLAHYSGSSEDGSAVLFPGNQGLPRTPAGHAHFLLNWRSDDKRQGLFEAVLERCTPLIGPWMAQPFDLPGRLAKADRIEARWVRLNVPAKASPEELLALAEARIENLSLGDRRYAALKAPAAADFFITAVLFEDELKYGPDGVDETLLFIVSRRAKPRAMPQSRFVRGFRIDDYRTERLPVARALKDKSVLLLGCGGIGSFVGIDLARAGIGKLALLDFDVLEPGNSVRWPLGRPFWGLDKAAALFWFLKSNYPWTEVTPWRSRIGETISDPAEIPAMPANPREQLEQLVRAADVVIDATASDECQLAVAALCRDLGKPLVVGYATEGVAGGVVARFRPARPGCLVCLHDHWSAGAIPLPPIDADGSLVPLGCNAPTFTGGAFDLQEVSLEIVRSAIGLLAPDERDVGDWDWSSLALVDGKRRCLPTWEHGIIAPVPECPCGEQQQ